MSRTVLIVDNSNSDRKAIISCLDDRFGTLEASDFRKMIEILRESASCISAVVINLCMSGTDGYEGLRMIRSSSIYGQIPIIAITDSCDDASHLKALRLGANGYIHMPVYRELLVHVLLNAIELSENSRPVNSYRSDALTGLPSRMAFFELVSGMIAKRAPGYYVLSCLDIENFKVVNDQYGIDKGDELLRDLARQLSEIMENIGGVCCRYNADKYGMLYPASYQYSDEFLRMHEAIKNSPYGRSIKMRIGRYLVNDPNVPINAMFDRATMAEESIKGRYDSYIAYYDDSMRDRIIREQLIVNEMEQALSSGEFEVWFQPQYNHSTGAMIGSEALVRWNRGGQYFDPSGFVPVFERNGFIYEMDLYVCETVCKLLRRWLDEGKNPLPISINISRRDIFYPGFVEMLTGIIDKYHLRYSLIRLEVTESAFSESTGKVIETVGRLIELGFIIEIDDFGSGYSSLNTLKDVPAQVLKLDMRFLTSTGDQHRGGNIISSIVRMASWLGMSVIAEGVENKAQADYLVSVGCDYIQGYLYAKPMPAKQFELVMDGSYTENRLTKLVSAETFDSNQFWQPDSMDTLIFSSYVGAACIYEYHNGATGLLRVNKQFQSMMNSFSDGLGFVNSKITPVSFMDVYSKNEYNDALMRTVNTHNEISCEVKLTDNDTPERAVFHRLTLRTISRAGDRYLIYCVVVDLTELRQSQQKRATTARRLRIITENIDSGVAAVRMSSADNAEIIIANDMFYSLFGLSKDEPNSGEHSFYHCISKNCTDADDHMSIAEKMKRVFETGTPDKAIARCSRCDGNTLYLSISIRRASLDDVDDALVLNAADVTNIVGSA